MAQSNPPTDEELAKDLEYYFERAATADEVQGYRDWLADNKSTDIAEYVDAVRAL